MSPRRSTRALKAEPRRMNGASLHHGAHTSKDPIPAPCPGTLDVDEATLRKLTRAKLQKLAKENKVKANMKSDTIIQELLKLCEVVPIHQNEESEEPPRKRLRTSLPDQPPSGPPRRVSKDTPPVAGPSTQIMDVPVDKNLYHPPPQDVPQRSAVKTENTVPIIAARNADDNFAANSSPISTSQGPSPSLKIHTTPPVPEDGTSDSASDLSYASQHNYNPPVSSRVGTPPPEEPMMVKRTVNMMNHITSDDQRTLAEIAALHERAKMLREQAQKARDVVRAEQGRRERLDIYFTYWREISPIWPRDWIYEGKEEQIKFWQRNEYPPLVFWSMSRRFHNIPRSVAVVRQGVVVESSLGPVRVPTIDGWYLSRQPFQAAYLRGCDVILGCDWLQSIRPAVFNGRLLSSSIDAVTILGVGHEWFSHPNGSSNARASQVQDDSFAAQVLDLYLSVVK
ncbi:hypothetical protein DFH29DRAFT_876423 [Suillus ampliporus]|nr:hypothetical protein DFH29DRAFT_876423 [Suillus ampliporus]